METRELAPLATPAQDFGAAGRYLAGLHSETGRRTMATQARKIARALGHFVIDEHGREIGQPGQVNWATLNADNVAALVERANVGAKPATARAMLNCLKGIARSCRRARTIDAETYLEIRSVKGARGSRLAAGRDVTPAERGALLRACAQDPTPAGRRDAALLALAMATGLRREELATLAIAGLSFDTAAGHVMLRIVGKGDKERTVYVNNGAMAALRDWLAVRGSDPGAVFCAIDKAGRMRPGATMTTTALHYILLRRAQQAAIAPMTWHDLRRTLVGDLLEAGVDIATVAAVVGHANVTTTARYDRRGERTKVAAAARVSVPYYGHL